MDNNLERDSVARERIVSETDRNFFVEAGAGSGKTTMLVSRMVAMVEQGKDISKICAITFTKAAAGEFYERFQKLLIERSNPDYVWSDKGYAGQLPAPTEETRKRCADALQNIDLCFMGTIDSFCGMILSEHPSEAGIPSNATLISELDAQAVYKQLYVRICAGDYGEDLRRLARLHNIFYWNPEEVFVKAMSLFMNNRNVEFHFTETALQSIDLDRQFASEKAGLMKALQCISDHEEILYDKSNDDKKVKQDLPNAMNTLKRCNNSWTRNCASVLSALKKVKGIRLIPSEIPSYPNELGGQCQSGGAKGLWYVLNAFQSGGMYETILEMQYQISMTFVHKCIPVVEREMKQKGSLTYFDYLFYLRNLLKRDAEAEGKLIRYIYDRHSYFLIDEFQDTNPMQAEVFFYLTAEKPEAQWSDCVPRPGSLFIVGDPKQSIYRFRSADVSAFLAVKKLFAEKGGDVLYLSRNFRSTKKMCEYFNRVFPGLLPTETDTQSKFETIPLPEEETTEFQGVYFYQDDAGANAGAGVGANANADASVPAGANTNAPANAGAPANGQPVQKEGDPVLIGKIITRLVNNPAYRITGSGEREPRRIRYSDFMVITYSKESLAPILAEMDRLEIPTKVEGKVPFEKNEALREIHKIYQCAADPYDKSAAYNALLGKLMGFVRGDVIKYAAGGGRLELNDAEVTDDKSDMTVRLVAEGIRRLYALSRKAIKLSPAALFAEIMEEFRIYEAVEAENLEVLYYTLELLRNGEKAGTVVSLKDGADYIGKLLEGKTEEERCLSLNDAKDCVHMANLHKVKGLEAPIVILAESKTGPTSANIRVKHTLAGAEGYLFDLAVKSDSGRPYYYFTTTNFSAEKEAEKKELDEEKTRLLYVAATRARNALIICSGDLRWNRWKTLLEKGTPDIFQFAAENTDKLVQEPKEVKAKELYERAAQESVFNDRSGEESTYTLKNPSQIRTPSKLAETDSEEMNIKSEIPAREAVLEAHRFPDLLGTMVHRLMEVLVMSRNHINTEDTIDEIIREYRTPRSKDHENVMKTALQKVASQVQNGGYEQTNGAPTDILGLLLSADEVHCEVPFCYKEESGDGTSLWNGVIDVLYQKDGKWHIIDYKTNLDDHELDRKYQNQMQAYIAALKVTAGEEADALIYHITV